MALERERDPGDTAASGGPVDLRRPIAEDTPASIIPVAKDPERPIRRVGRKRAAGPARDRAAANDDVPSIGGLLFALNQKPSSRPFQVAAIGSGVWVALSLLLGWALLASDIQAGASTLTLLSKPATLAILATIVIPTALFWFLALLIWRAQELRLMSSAMTEVAVRLAEPDRMAEQSVASLGQSVRRQVAAVNDAISRALGRAGELEALVHNEVAALERSYGENEFRIRTLIDELASERDALGNNSERVGEALRGATAQIQREIATASERAARTLFEASAALSDQLAQQSAQTGHMLSEGGNVLLHSLSEMHQRIGSEVPALIEKMGEEQTRLTRIVEGAAKNLAALETVLAQRTGQLEAGLGERTSHLQTVLEDYTRAVGDTILEQTQSLESTFGQRTQALGQRLQAFDIAFTEKARALDAAVGDKLASIDAGLARTAEIVEGALGERTANLDAALIERTRAIDEAFGDRMRAIDVAFDDRLRNLDESIERGAHAIDSAIAGRANKLRQAMEAHAQALSQQLERQSITLDETLVRGIEAVRQTSESITSQSIQTISGLSVQAKLLKELSEGLLSQMAQLTDRFEQQGQTLVRASHALENTNVKFDSARENSDAMRRALQDQLKALDALSNMTREQAIRRDVTPPEGSTLPSLARGYDSPSRQVEQAVLHHQRAPVAQPVYPPGASYPPPSLPAGTADHAAATRTRASMPPSQAPAPAHDTSGRDSWSLGDLLARASLEDEDAPASTRPAPTPQPSAAATLPTTRPPAAVPQLTLETMAQALDQPAAAAIWHRLRSGERMVMNRQLFTPAGQQTFDEITRRLRADDGFRTMTDRYVADFERLMRESEQKDPSGRQLQNHLVADTGRVYLLLAYATGRIS